MRTIKLVIIGDSSVGKTSLRNQYITGHFSTGYRATIGTDFITKTVPHYQNLEESVTLQIWDTAGQERFSSLSTAFFRGADAALLMFDVNRPETLSTLSKWWDEFKAHAPVPDEEAEDFCCVVVGNKIDLAEDEDAKAEPTASGSGQEHTRVSEAEAERFLEELVPRVSTLNDDENSEYEYDEYDDPFMVHGDEGQSRRTTGLFMRRSISGFSLHSVMHPHFEPEDEGEGDRVSDSPPHTQTRSISIQSSGSYKHPFRKRNQKSRSSERSQFGGTVTTTHTTQTIYHTPASSLFDTFESAPSSPIHDDHDLPASPVSVAGEPATPSTRAPRRMTSTSSSSSAPTITPSLFMRTQASASTSAAPTPPTPIECSSSDFPFTAATAVRSRRSVPPLPPRPERRPRLFLASAKTGVGVAPVFEHIARRVAMRWTYAEAVEARAILVHEPSAAAETLRLGLAGSSSGTRAPSLRERLAGGASCCGS